MKEVNKIIGFAKQVAEEDEVRIRQLEEWESFVKPLFKNKFGCDYMLAHEGMYSIDWTDWLKAKRVLFHNL